MQLPGPGARFPGMLQQAQSSSAVSSASPADLGACRRKGPAAAPPWSPAAPRPPPPRPPARTPCAVRAHGKEHIVASNSRLLRKVWPAVLCTWHKVKLHSLLPSCLSCFLPAPGPALRTPDYSKQHPSPQAEAPHLELRLSFRGTQLAGGHGGQRLHLRIKEKEVCLR